MHRREFIKTGTAALASSLLPLNSVTGDESGAVVWEAEGPQPAAVEALFAALGGLEKIMPVDPARALVVLKPNICLPHSPSMGTTTSPELVDALCGFLAARGVRRIIVADHTLQGHGFDRMELMQRVQRHPNAKVMLIDAQRWYGPVQVGGKVLESAELLKMLKRVDLLLNLPVAKHHVATQVSLATKNLMGLIWDRTVFHTQLDLAQAIGDLALVVRPHLNIVDARRVLLDGGPTGPGRVIDENRLFASSDIVAVDAVVASRYDFGRRSLSPREIPHLQAAFQNRVGEIDLAKIRVEQLPT